MRPAVQQSVDLHFQSTARQWRDIYQWKDLTSRLYQERHERVLRTIQELRLPAGARILEIGSGPGKLAVELGLLGYRVDAIDSSPALVEMTRELAIESNVTENVSAKIGDAYKLAFEDGSFDLVVAVGVFDWLKSLAQPLSEVRRVLKPAGAAVVTIGNPWAWEFTLDPRMNPLLNPVKAFACGVLKRFGKQFRPPLCMRSKRTMKRAVEDAGLGFRGRRVFGFGPLTFLGKHIVSDGLATVLHENLQPLADKNIPVFREGGRTQILCLSKQISEKRKV